MSLPLKNEKAKLIFGFERREKWFLGPGFRMQENKVIFLGPSSEEGGFRQQVLRRGGFAFNHI